MDDGDYEIRIPVEMIQRTDKDGKAWPLAFEWKDGNGENIRVKIERVLSCIPYAEQKSGTVGDRYECLIGGQPEYLYYTILQPRKWFKLKSVSREEYDSYYRLPEES
jgi:hypothetical protein